MQVKYPKPVFLPDDQPRITYAFLSCIEDLVAPAYQDDMMIRLQDEWRLESSRALATVDGLIWG
jgi:hypothetical protein